MMRDDDLSGQQLYPGNGILGSLCRQSTGKEFSSRFYAAGDLGIYVH